MKKMLLFLLGSSFLLQAAATEEPATHKEQIKPMAPIDRCDFKTKMRELWNDHGVWTRQYIVSALADSPSAPSAAKRLMRNQEDIGNAVIPFYGKEAGHTLTKLLKEHISIAVDIVAAAKKNDKKAVAARTKCWQKNALDISRFLSKANPHIKEADMFAMMKQHLSITGNEVPLRLKKQWAEEVKNYDAVRKQLNGMADALSQAIMKQFPERFNGHCSFSHHHEA